MSILDLHPSNAHTNNLYHFSALVKLAQIDGELNEQEESLIKNFARKLDISEDEYAKVLIENNPYPLDAPVTAKERLEHLLDFFKIIYSDHQIDPPEMHLLKKYAIGLGYTEEAAAEIINKSMRLFSGRIDVDEYEQVLKIINY